MTDRKPILLVENDAKDRDLFLEACREAGVNHDLVIARDGEEALRLLLPPAGSSAAPLHPAAVVLDLLLPTLGGIGVLRQIKAAPATRLVPVIVFTSLRDPQHCALSYQVGANAYVAKPMQYSELVEAVRVLGRFWTGVNRLPPRQTVGLA